MAEEIILTPEIEERIREYFVDPSKEVDLAEMTREVFNDSTIDGKRKEARLVKQFCKDNNLKYSTRTTVLLGDLVLTAEQEKRIQEEYRNFSPLNLTKWVFEDNSLTNLSQQHRTVQNYVKKLAENTKKELLTKAKQSSTNGNMEEVSIGYLLETNEDDLALETYVPPTNLAQTIKKINQYLNLSWSEASLNKRDRENCEKLHQYLKIFRFQHQINSYKKKSDRNLFEDSFIRYTYDKNDLTQEELDQFINVCNHVVLANDLQHRMEYLKAQIVIAGYSQKLSDMINTIQTEYNSCIVRSNKLYDTLTGQRKTRLEEKSDTSLKLVNLVNAWKNEEFRKKYAILAMKEKEALKEEAKTLGTFDDLKALLMGATVEELTA